MRSHQNDIKTPNNSVLHVVGTQPGDAVIGALYQGLGVRKTQELCLKNSKCLSASSSDVLGHALPQDSLVQALGK